MRFYKEGLARIAVPTWGYPKPIDWIDLVLIDGNESFHFDVEHESLAQLNLEQVELVADGYDWHPGIEPTEPVWMGDRWSLPADPMTVEALGQPGDKLGGMVGYVAHYNNATYELDLELSVPLFYWQADTPVDLDGTDFLILIDAAGAAEVVDGSA